MAYRRKGEQAGFSSSQANGVTSQKSGWSPLAIELVEVDSSYCNTVRPWLNFYAFVIFFLLVTVVRVGARHALMFMVFQGCLFLATFEVNNVHTHTRTHTHARTQRTQHMTHTQAQTHVPTHTQERARTRAFITRARHHTPTFTRTHSDGLSPTRL